VNCVEYVAKLHWQRGNMCVMENADCIINDMERIPLSNAWQPHAVMRCWFSKPFNVDTNRG